MITNFLKIIKIEQIYKFSCKKGKPIFFDRYKLDSFVKLKFKKNFLFISELSQHVVDAGSVPLLVLCLQEPEIALKRVAASALSDIAKHSPELAQTVVDAGAIAHLAQMILNPDAQLKVNYLKNQFNK